MYTFLVYEPRDSPFGRGCRDEAPGCLETCQLGPAKNGGDLSVCRSYHICWHVHASKDEFCEHGGTIPIPLATPVRGKGGNWVDHYVVEGDDRRIVTQADNAPPLHRAWDGKYWIESGEIGDLAGCNCVERDFKGIPFVGWINGVFFEKQGSPEDFKKHRRYLAMPDSEWECMAEGMLWHPEGQKGLAKVDALASVIEREVI